MGRCAEGGSAAGVARPELPRPGPGAARSLRRSGGASLSRSSDQQCLARSRPNDEQGRRGQVSGSAEARFNTKYRYRVPSLAPGDDKEHQEWTRPSLGISNVNCDLETQKPNLRCAAEHSEQ